MKKYHFGKGWEEYDYWGKIYTPVHITYIYMYKRSQMVEVQAFVFWFFEGLTEYGLASLKLSSRRSLITRPTKCSFDTYTGTRSVLQYVHVYITCIYYYGHPEKILKFLPCF